MHASVNQVQRELLTFHIYLALLHSGERNGKKANLRSYPQASLGLMYEFMPAENSFLAGTGYLKNSVPFSLLDSVSVEGDTESDK